MSDPSSAEPLDLLARAAAAGDDRAVAELVRATQVPIVRLCAHLTSPAEAEDLAQETYLRMLRAVHSYRGEAPVLMWLMAIARRACADHVRKRVRRSAIDRARPGRERVQAPDHSVVLIDLLERLPAEQRLAFELTQVLGFPYEQAAALCGCPVGTIRSRVARARVELVGRVRASEVG